MTFSIGRAGLDMGPGHALESFGDSTADRSLNLSVLRRLLAYVWPHRWRMAAALVLMVVCALLTLAVPYLMKLTIDQAIALGDSTELARISLAMIVALIGIYWTSWRQQAILSWVGERILATLRSELFQHLQALSLGYHDKHLVGITVSRVINDVAAINDLLSQGLMTLLQDLLVLVGTVTVMLTMSVRLALLSFTVMPLMVVATVLFAKRAQVAFVETRVRIAAVVGDLAENLSGIRVIQAFAQQDASQQRFDEVNSSNRDAHIGAMSLSFVFIPTVEFLGMLATAVVLLFGGRDVINGSVTVGVLVAFLAYVTRFFQPIRELSQVYATLQSALAAGEKVLDLLDTSPALSDLPGAIEMDTIEGRVELRDVSFAYQEGEEVLHGINLLVEPGQTLAIVGPTGAGKTSIANLVARFYEVSDGAVLVDGVDVRRVQMGSLRRQMALVPQEPFLFAGTLADNIRFGHPDATDAEVQEAARLADVHEFVSSLPEGYNTRVQEGAANLSVGQRQLLCIARAILSDPRILILDEATSSVDTLTELKIQRALHNLLEGRTALVIAHRLSTVRRADLICVLQDGRIVERGTHEQLLARGGLYRELYEKQFVREGV